MSRMRKKQKSSENVRVYPPCRIGTYYMQNNYKG